MQIWDTAGQERFRNITQNYYRKAQGTLLVYDVTNRPSFASVDTWMKTIQQHAGDSINKILVGNKMDCEAQRVVQYSEGENLAKKYNIKFFETSAKTQQNVTGMLWCDIFDSVLRSDVTLPALFFNSTECFEAIATECYKRQLAETSQVSTGGSGGVTKLTASTAPKKKGCC